MGRTVEELERSLSWSEWVEWREFYLIDPWGEQRADLRMAQIASAALFPHVKPKPEPAAFMLFPDERLDLPDDASALERRWMLALKRNKGDAE